MPAMDGSDFRRARAGPNPALSAAQTAPSAAPETRSELPYVLIEPLRRTAPLIFSSPHSGRRYPTELLAQTRVGLLSLRTAGSGVVT